MFSMKIIDSDAFIDMPMSSQLLYFHLSMRADDDGFVSNPKKIIRMLGSSDDDYKVLIAKRFIIQFENGICVIKHWKIHNYIQSDRYKETVYIDEKKSLNIKENGSYTECIQNVYTLDTEVKLNKVKLNKIKLDSNTKTQDFFTNNKLQENVLDLLEKKGLPNELAINEIKSFIEYWTETDKIGKMRYQGEKYFDIKRRIATWVNNSNKIKDFKKNQSKTINLDNL